METVQKLSAEKALDLKAAAVVVKNKDGEIRVHELGDVVPAQGGRFGVFTGAFIGLLVGGPVGIVAGAALGGAAGALIGRAIDLGVPESLIEDVKRDLIPGSSAIITYAALDWTPKAVASLRKEGATVHHETIEEEAWTDLLADPGAPPVAYA